MSSQTRQTQPAQQTAPPAQQTSPSFADMVTQFRQAVTQFQQAQQQTAPAPTQAQPVQQAQAQTPPTAPGATRPPTRIPPTRVPPTRTPPPRNPPPSADGVDWPSAVAFSRRTAKAGDALAAGLDKAALDRTRIPVLLPTDATLLAGARLYSFGDHYTISGDIPGGGISLTGTTAVVKTTTRLNVSFEGPMQLVLQRTVDGYLASFTRFGVLYTVEVRCDSPKDDRCRSDAFVRDLTAKTTVVVLGKAARQAAGIGG